MPTPRPRPLSLDNNGTRVATNHTRETGKDERLKHQTIINEKPNVASRGTHKVQADRENITETKESLM